MSSVTGSSPHHPTICGGCGAQIWFAVTTANRRPMPLDVTPSDEGNVAVYQDSTQTWLARVMKKDMPAQSFERVYMPHFATCPKVDEFRKTVGRQIARLAPVIDLHTRQRLA